MCIIIISIIVILVERYSYWISFLMENTVWKIVHNFPCVAEASVSKHLQSWVTFRIHDSFSLQNVFSIFLPWPHSFQKIMVMCWAF